MPLNENPFFNKLAKPKEEEELFDNPEEDAPQFENTEDIENFGDELGLPETQQIPYAPKEDLRMMDTLDAIKANPTIVPENDGGAGDSYYADTLPEQQNVEQGIQDKISEVDKIKQLIAKSKAARGQSPQQEEAQIDPSTGKLIEARKNRDMQRALAQMMSGIKRAGAAYGGAGLTQIKANTDFEDSMTKNAGQGVTDIKEDIALANANRKEKEAKEVSDMRKLLMQSQISKAKRPIDKSMTEYERKKLELEEKKINGKQSKEKKDLSFAQKQVDKEFAKDYNDFVAAGGYADVKKQLVQLKEVADKLPSMVTASGGVTGLTPKIIRDVLPWMSEGAAMQDAVEEVVQRNLRLILGAQFTEKEGERLIDRAYNPRQGEEENEKRVKRLINQISSAAKAKVRAAKYYEDNGTLVGYKGELYRSADDFLADEEQSNYVTVNPSESNKKEGETWSDRKYNYKMVNGKPRRKAK